MLERIKNVTPEEMDVLLPAVLDRYRELYPQWDITIISLDKRKNREEQISKIIEFLQNMKTQM